MKSDNSHYSIFKEQKLSFDQVSKLQSSIGPIGPIKRSSLADRISSFGGGEGIRTPDPMVANHVLCQLSYTPGACSRCTRNMVGLGGFELPTSPLSGVRSNQLSYRPAGLLPQNKGYKHLPVALIWFAAPCLQLNCKRSSERSFKTR